ncbi:hypothetical protein GLOIN_2v1662649 [Rhizophagus irregularis DAOM 181602=DAOM 197198]|nr:hypothetical protein GLOIN_2v1662649 [Rhizophagus irregularis DAOM 181602=DAOM 197198]
MTQLRPFKKDIRQIWRIYGKISRNYWLERYARLIPIEINNILKKLKKMKMFNNEIKAAADTTTSNIPSRSNVWSHVSSRLSSPHVSSSQSGNLHLL